jgi:lipoprotein-anchoring transpeptidase ErfK/SrfK
MGTCSVHVVRNTFGALFVAVSIFLSFSWTPLHAQANDGIDGPRAGSTVHGLVDVTGSAAHDTFRKWQLDLLIDGDAAQATFLAVGEEPTAGSALLTSVDTSLYPDGNHSLRLRIVHSNLNYDEYITPIVVRNIGVRNTGRSVAINAVTSVEEQKPLDVVAQDATSTASPASSQKKTGAWLPSPKANSRTFAPPADERWIEVDISEQTLTAWNGDDIFMQTTISSGRPETPTVAGVFSVERKVDMQRMVGPDYDLPNVTSVMYFFLNYAIHAAYWHDDFGTVASHGCVNMRVDEAAALFAWAEVGTPVYVHD